MDSSKPTVKGEKEIPLKIHMVSALKYLLSSNELNRLHGEKYVSDMEQAMKPLEIGKAVDFGIRRELANGKLYFIHRYFAEYFAAKWVNDNFRKCDILFQTFFSKQRIFLIECLPKIPKFMAPF